MGRKYFISALKVPYYKIKFINRNPPGWYRKILNLPPVIPPRLAKYFGIKDVGAKHKVTLFTVLDKNKISPVLGFLKHI